MNIKIICCQVLILLLMLAAVVRDHLLVAILFALFLVIIELAGIRGAIEKAASQDTALR